MAGASRCASGHAMSLHEATGHKRASWDPAPASVLRVPACSALSLPCGLSALPCMRVAGENATERGTRPSLHPPGPQLPPPVHCHSLPLSNMDFKPCLSQIIECSAPKRSLTGSMRALSVGFLLTPLSLERRSQHPRPGRLPRDTECHPHWTQSSAKCRS